MKLIFCISLICLSLQLNAQPKTYMGKIKGFSVKYFPEFEIGEFVASNQLTFSNPINDKKPIGSIQISRITGIKNLDDYALLENWRKETYYNSKSKKNELKFTEERILLNGDSCLTFKHSFKQNDKSWEFEFHYLVKSNSTFYEIYGLGDNYSFSDPQPVINIDESLEGKLLLIAESFKIKTTVKK